MAAILCLGFSAQSYARYYDPFLGRFISPDAIVQKPSDPQTLNRYAYARNNPVILVDPSGRAFFVPFLVATAVFAATSATVAALNGANSSAIWTAAWQGAVQGASFGVGMAAGGPFLGGLVAGGTGGALNGGTFEIARGAILGGVSAGFASKIPIPQNAWAAAATRTGVGAGFGGAISEITGGNFREGAAQGALFGAVSSAYLGGTNRALSNHYWRRVNQIGNDQSISFEHRAEQIQAIYTRVGQMGLKIPDFRMAQVTIESASFNRYWSGNGRAGPWITTEKWGSPIEARELNALPVENLATNVSEVTVGPGSRLIWGISQPANGRPGGGIEIYIDRGNGVQYHPGEPLK